MRQKRKRQVFVMDDDNVKELRQSLPAGSGMVTSTHPDRCELCGRNAELRPYGPRGENICFDCGMKDEETTQRQFRRVVFDEVTQ